MSKKVRGLAWVVVKWAKAKRPRIIMLENVEEFKDWGPLLLNDSGKYSPCPERKGHTFRRWVGELQRLGYVIEWRTLRACEFGAPTIRKRLFLIARRDGQPICWPQPTHGDPASKSVANGTLPPWATAADIIDWSLPAHSIFLSPEQARAVGVRRPLAEATMARIARGVQRFIIDESEPFIVTANHAGGFRGQGPGEPFKTVTSARDAHGLVVPSVIPIAHYNGRVTAHPRGGSYALVTAFLAKHYGGNYTGPGHDLRTQVGTVTAVDHHALVACSLVKLRGSCRDGQSVTTPMPTVTGGGTHVGEVRVFLTKYYGTSTGQKLTEPAHTITAKARMGIVTVTGHDYAITDIGMRMLSPRELYRAQGFPDSYIIAPMVNGRKLSKTAQVRMCGNSVVPHLSKALVRSNFSHQAIVSRVPPRKVRPIANTVEGKQ